jgi:hypothetical protein
MGGGYEPFPIYDLRSGLQLDREPWLLPSNAFSKAENIYFYNGRVFKRRGYERFATGTGGTGVNVLASPPCTGIYEYYTKAGASYLMAFDTDYMYQYDPTNDNWVGKAGYTSDPKVPDWTGDITNFFWAEIWQDLLFITNDKDAIKYWNGTTLATLSGTGVPTTCKFLVAHKNRLIALNVLESANRHPQRYRCSNLGSYSDWDDDIYADADTVDWISGIAFVRGELMVFFERSVWWLRYTGDADVPFSWEKIAETEGIYAPYSVVGFEDEAIGLGPTSWIGCDGLQVYGIDEKVPDLVLTMNQNALEYGYGFLVEELRQYLCSYPTVGSDYADQMLCFNYVDNLFSIYKLPMHVAGYWGQGDALTYDDYPATTYDEMAVIYDEKTLTAGYPITLIGDRSGYINKLFTVDADNGSAIASSLKTKRLMPYQDKMSKLGYVDIIGASSSAFSLTVKFYKDYRSVPYKTAIIDMYDSKGGDKVRKRIRVMEKAAHGHIIEIMDNATNNPYVIDAIIPHFKEAGTKK